MIDCLTCRNAAWVDNFHTQYDGMVTLYDDKFGTMGSALYALTKPLLKPVEFSNRIEFTRYGIWHHEGRRPRHGASMTGPGCTQWHEIYEVARHFYSEYLANEAGSKDPRRARAATALKARLDEVLASDDHKSYVGKMSLEEK